MNNEKKIEFPADLNYGKALAYFNAIGPDSITDEQALQLLNFQDPTTKMTLLHRAVYQSNPRFTQFLLNKASKLSESNQFKLGAYLIKPNNFCETSLHISCKQRDSDIVSLLIETVKECNDFSLEDLGLEGDGSEGVESEYDFIKGEAFKYYLLLENDNKESPFDLALKNKNSSTFNTLSEAAESIDLNVLSEALLIDVNYIPQNQPLPPLPALSFRKGRANSQTSTAEQKRILRNLPPSRQR